MLRDVKRYIDEAPQRYKVVGYSVKPTVEQDRIKMNIKISNHAPLDVTPIFNSMVQIII